MKINVAQYRTNECRTRGRLHMTASLAIAAALLIPSAPAIAQETRADIIREQQANKQLVTAPPVSNRAEAVIDRLEDWGFFMGQPRGFYPWLGSVFPGGGLAAGAGVRKPFGDDGGVSVLGGYSFNSFWRAEANLELPTFAQNRARITLSGRYVDAPDVRYHGIGNDTRQEDETRYGYTPAGGGARLDVEASRYLSLGGGVTYLDINTSTGGTTPSIEERFSAGDTPGLEFDSFSYINSTARAAFDWRRPAGYSGTGGLYRVQFDDYRERDHDVYSFRSLEAEVRQMIPLLRANWVLALRGLATVTDIDEASAVPYFLLPSLGGGSTLRGFPDFRFRDRHRLFMNAEVRWTPARFVDMAVFYDTGKVASRRSDLDFDDLQDAYGIGMRVVGPKGYAFRVEVAHSREHSARLIFGAGGTF
jgi:outer membrane protein assembly factor BamA